MTDKSKKRRKDLATRMNVSRRTAANINAAKFTASRTKLRAVNAAHAASNSSGRYRVRPFSEVFENGPDLKPVAFEGAIEGQAFVVHVFGVKVPLKTVEAGHDRWGPYAVILDGEYSIVEDFTISVDIDPDEDGMHGCELSVTRRVGNGIDPASGFSLYFGTGGSLNGSSGMRRPKSTLSLPPTPPPRVPGELTPLTFTCLLCRTSRDLPLRDFASGTIFCPNHDPPRQFDIPNNTRYRRLAHEIDALNARHGGTVTVGLIAINTEPYLVLHRSPRVEVAHVDTWETRPVAVGHWNGPGNMLRWETPVNTNISAGVLMWLEKSETAAA
jgi:hypothetical protein